MTTSSSSSDTLQPFPADFLIGASTAAHQVEGNNVNSNWWVFEHTPGTPMAEPSGDAADSYHRWRDDLDIVADLGLDAYRFSIEWARVEPAAGHVSQAEIQHYRRMVDGARQRGIEPIVTLHHFTEPRWFWHAGSWAAPDAVEHFVRYVDALAPVLEGVRWVVTINEPNMAAIMARITQRFDGLADSSGSGGVAHTTDEAAVDPGASGAGADGATGHPGGAADTRRDRPSDGRLPRPDEATRDALIAAHRAARDALHARHPDMQVGWSIANQAVQAQPGGEQAAADYTETREDVFLRESRDDDFVGVQSYTRTIFGPDGTVVRDDPTDERTLTGWEFYPDALGEAVRHTRDVAGDVPVLVTENGLATDDDQRRIAYTHGALAGLRRAMDDGCDVRGYLHWSLLDNYEWGSYHATFGLVGWDPQTFARQPKPSARWLGDVARGRARSQG